VPAQDTVKILLKTTQIDHSKMLCRMTYLPRLGWLFPDSLAALIGLNKKNRRTMNYLNHLNSGHPVCLLSSRYGSFLKQTNKTSPETKQAEAGGRPGA
jgi:hypothetical protein